MCNVSLPEMQISRSSTRWSRTQRRSCRPSLCPTSFAPTRWWQLRTSLKTRCASFTPTSPKTRPLGSTTLNLQSVSQAAGICGARHSRCAQICLLPYFSALEPMDVENSENSGYIKTELISVSEVWVFILNQNEVCRSQLKRCRCPSAADTPLNFRTTWCRCLPMTTRPWLRWSPPETSLLWWALPL